MPQSTTDLPTCSNCDGFHAVAVTTGQRLPDGSRKTVTIHCALHGDEQPVRSPADTSRKTFAVDRAEAR